MSIMWNFPYFIGGWDLGRCHKGNKVRLYSAKLLNIENEHIKERAYSYELALTLLQYLQKYD